jgi:DNA-binding NtrC family response regulator
VLIVDDEKDLLSTIEDGLKSYEDRFHVLTAENGKKAVEVLESIQVDLLITDLKMPEMGGLELIAYMTESFPSIPVIVMSAFLTLETREEIESKKSVRFMEKPIDFHELVDAISEGLEYD